MHNFVPPSAAVNCEPPSGGLRKIQAIMFVKMILNATLIEAKKAIEINFAGQIRIPTADVAKYIRWCLEQGHANWCPSQKGEEIDADQDPQQA